MSNNIKLIIVGTAVGSGKGGISVSLQGYIQGLNELEQDYIFVNSHVCSVSFFTGLKVWFKALTEVRKHIVQCKASGYRPVVWLHTAAWYSLARKTSFAWVSKYFGAKVIAQFHSISTLSYLHRPIKRFFFKICVSSIDKAFVLTPWWENTFKRFFPLLEIDVVPNPVCNNLLKLVDSSKDIEKNRKDVVIFAMSRLVNGKGFEQLINTMPLLEPSYVLKIAGDGPLLVSLKKQVNDLELNDRVEFFGWVDMTTKVNSMLQSDVFCLPSKNDSFGMVYIEAMACGLPVVALNSGAIPDVIKNGVEGVLIENDSPTTIANGILLANRNRISYISEAKNKVSTTYTPTIVVKTIMTNLNKLY